jgi:hypothetical protein
MILNENKIIPYRMTKKAKRQQKLNEAAQRVLQNKHAEMDIMNENSNIENENRMKTNLANYRASNGYYKRKLLAEKTNFRNKLSKQLFLESVNELFFEALLIDESIKETNREKISEEATQLIEKFMESKNLDLKGISKQNELLESLVLLCEKTAKEVAEVEYDKKGKILNELEKSEEDGLTEYKMDDDDAESGKESNNNSNIPYDFDDKKDIILRNIAEEIKSNVVEAVQKEQEISKRIEDEKREIKHSVDKESEMIDADPNYGLDPDTGNPEATTAGKMAGDKLNVPNSPDDDEVHEQYTRVTGQKSAPATTFQKKIVENYQPLKITRNRKPAIRSIYNEIMTQTAKSLVLQENGTINENTLNMDLVMSNALVYCTLLETMKVIGMVENKPSEILFK